MSSFVFDVSGKEQGVDKEKRQKTAFVNQGVQGKASGVLGGWVSKHVEELDKMLKEQAGRDRLVYPLLLPKNVPYVSPNATKILLLSFYDILTKAGKALPSFPAILLLGPPGVGKSTVVKEVTSIIAQSVPGREIVDINDKPELVAELYSKIRKCLGQDDREKCLENLEKQYFIFLDLRLTEVEPSDLMGIPYNDGGIMKYVPPLWAYVMHYIPGVLFLDEITNIERNDVMAASFKLFLDRSAGFVKLHPHTLVVAAGNLSTHSQIARSLPFPLVNRSCVFYVAPPSVEDWYRWMINQLNKMYGATGGGSSQGGTDDIKDYLKTLILVRSVLTVYPHLFISQPSDEEAAINENNPTPRSWSHFVFTTPFSKLEALLRIDEAVFGAGREAQVSELTDESLKGGVSSYFNSYVASMIGTRALYHLKQFVMLQLSHNLDEIIQNPNLVEQAIADISSRMGDKAITSVMVFAKLLGSYAVMSDIDLKTEIELHKKIIESVYKFIVKNGNESIAKSFVETYISHLHEDISLLIRLVSSPAKFFDIMNKKNMVANELEKFKMELFKGQA